MVNELTRKRIMIVEDMRNLHSLYSGFLEGHGYSVAWSAYDGREAIRMYDAADPKPDVIIMDYRMPEMDGLSATKEILKKNGNQKIIFTSADIKIIEDAYQTGIIKFLSKPFRLSDLLRAVSEIPY